MKKIVILGLMMCTCLFADSYKGFEWGEQIQTLIDNEEINTAEGMSKITVEEDSIYHLLYWDDALNHYFKVPLVSTNGGSDVRSIKQIKASWLNWAAGVPYVYYKPSDAIKVKYYSKQSETSLDNSDPPPQSTVAFYEDKYFFYKTENVIIKPTMMALIKKYGQGNKFEFYSLTYNSATFRYSTWISGDTVILLISLIQPEYQGYDNSRGTLVYMSKKITDELIGKIKHDYDTGIKEALINKQQEENKSIEYVE